MIVYSLEFSKGVVRILNRKEKDDLLETLINYSMLHLFKQTFPKKVSFYQKVHREILHRKLQGLFRRWTQKFDEACIESWMLQKKRYFGWGK